MPEFGQESVSLMKGFKVVHRVKQTEDGCMQDGLRFYSKVLPPLWWKKILFKMGLYGEFMCRDISKPHMPFPGFKRPKIHPDRTR